MLLGHPDVWGGAVTGADQLVAVMGSVLSFCHNRWLTLHPDQHGTLIMILDLEPSGRVHETRLEGGDGLSPYTIKCLRNNMQAFTFAGVVGEKVQVRFPVTFEAASSTPDWPLPRRLGPITVGLPQVEGGTVNVGERGSCIQQATCRGE
jgi:hypothetical protein